jgi:chitinase
MQTIINIASIKDGHQQLVIETTNAQQVEEAVEKLEKKVKSGHFVCGKDKTGQDINIPRAQFKEFIKSDQYEEKAVLNALGGG